MVDTMKISQNQHRTFYTTTNEQQNTPRTTMATFASRSTRALPTTYTGPVLLRRKTGRRVRFADHNAPDLGLSDEENGLTQVCRFDKDEPASSISSDEEPVTPKRVSPPPRPLTRGKSVWVPPSVRRLQEEAERARANADTEEATGETNIISSDEDSDEWVPSDDEHEDDDYSMDTADDDDMEGINADNIVTGNREHRAPERLEDRHFLPGANNGHCAGRDVDTGRDI